MRYLKYFLVRFLIHLYPAAWREEYGEELQSLLLSTRSTAFSIGDVLLNAARQQLRRNEIWQRCGLFLFARSSFWIIWNSILPLSPAAYIFFTRTDGIVMVMVCFITGWGSILRGGRSIWQSASQAAKAAELGQLPELMVLVVNAIGLAPQILIDINGNPYPDQSGVALLRIRGPVDGVLEGIPGLIIVLPLIVFFLALLPGFCGALFGHTYAMLRVRLRQVH